MVETNDFNTDFMRPKRHSSKAFKFSEEKTHTQKAYQYNYRANIL